RRWSGSRPSRRGRSRAPRGWRRSRRGRACARPSAPRRAAAPRPGPPPPAPWRPRPRRRCRSRSRAPRAARPASAGRRRPGARARPARSPAVLRQGVRQAGVDAEAPVPALDLEAAAQERRPLAHAEDAVAAVDRRRRGCRRDRVRDVEPEPRLAVVDRHGGVAAAVAGGVREGLLQDPVRRLVEARRERPREALDADVDRDAGRAVPLDERVKRAEPGRRLDRLVGRVLAQPAHQLVDLADGLAGDVLDRRERRAGRLGVALLKQPGRARLHQDHVDRVGGRVVQVARDPGALLRGRQAALAGGVALRPRDPLLLFGPAPAAPAQAVAKAPRHAPDDDAEEDRRRREPVLRDRRRAQVDGEHAEDDGRRAAETMARAVVARDVEERDRRPERRPRLVAQGVDRGAGRGGHGEDGQRRAAVEDERQGRDGGQRDAGGVDRAGRAAAVGEQGQGERERDQRDDHVARHPGAGIRGLHPTPRVTPAGALRVAPQEDPRPPAGGGPGSFPGAFRRGEAVPRVKSMITITRFALRHRRLVALAWLAVAVAGIVSTGPATRALSDQYSVPGREGYVTNTAITRMFGNGGDGAPLVAVVTLPPGANVGSAQVRSGLAGVGRRIAAAVPRARIASYASTGDRAFVSRDGRTTFVLAYPPPTPGSFGQNAQAVSAARAALRGATVAGAPVH